MSDPGEKQFQVVVDFGRGADRRTRITRIDLLFDGDGRRDARDDVHVGFVDFAQKLPGIGRKALDVAALSLGIDRVERQGRLTRTGKAGYDLPGYGAGSPGLCFSGCEPGPPVF